MPNPKIIIRRRHDEPHPSEHLASSLTYTTQLEKKEGNGYRTLFSSPDYDVMEPWPDDTEKQLDRGTYRVTLAVQNVRLGVSYQYFGRDSRQNECSLG